MNLKDMEMPEKEAPEMEEEFDFGFEDEEMSDEASPFAEATDEELIEELKNRGFEVEDEAEVEGEEMAEEAPAEMPEEPAQ